MTSQSSQLSMPLARATAAHIDPRDVGTPDDWVERHPELIRLTGRHPFNCEPALTHLQTFLTPTPLHYVRNHGAVPKLEKASHQVQVTGLVTKPCSFTLPQLQAMFADSIVTLPVLLVCAGNRRKEQNMIKKSIGFSWGAGAAATAQWTGVPLHVLLSSCGVDYGSARYVWFEGADTLPHENYGTCLPIHTAMDPACDVLVAWGMNRELLSPDHGFPLRMIIPGHIGGRMVKWLARIHVSAQESTNYHHFHDNRVLPAHVDAEVANRDNWWSKPGYVINELNINSVVYAPAHDDEVNVVGAARDASDQVYQIRGYAYSGGGRRVTRVELTLDDGLSWELATITYDEKPTSAGKMWCWVHYELVVPLARLVHAQEICVRAWDIAMNTQPEFPTWNVMGMMNNPWFRVKIHKHTQGPSESKLVFEHPIQAGNLKGGWMTRGGRAGRTTNLVEPQSILQREDQLVAPIVETKEDDHSALPLISKEEVTYHTTKTSCWFICQDLVYDATPFLSEHPGGAASILLCAGTDCTDEFESIHSTKAWSMLEKYCIGRCPSENAKAMNGDQVTKLTDSAMITKPESSVALQGQGPVFLVLIEKKEVAHDARIFRFALPGKHQRLGLPVGNHVLLYACIAGKKVVRAYTPISDSDEPGFVSFLIKIYLAGENPAHPEGGLFSQHLDQLHLGSQLEVKGPLGHFTYKGRGAYLLDHGGDEPRSRIARKFGLIAGGTGITPVFQIMRTILSSPDDCTEVAVLYCARRESDLLLRHELEALQQLKPENCRLYFTLSEWNLGQDEAMAWSYGRTRITPAMIRDIIGTDACHVAMCGPPGMIEQACLPALEALGYSRKTQLTVL